MLDIMLIGTALIFTIGAALYIYDFFRTRPRFVPVEDAALDAGDRGMGARGPAAA